VSDQTYFFVPLNLWYGRHVKYALEQIEGLPRLSRGVAILSLLQDRFARQVDVTSLAGVGVLNYSLINIDTIIYGPSHGNSLFTNWTAAVLLNNPRTSLND
jgi:hypothetical protein